MGKQDKIFLATKNRRLVMDLGEESIRTGSRNEISVPLDAMCFKRPLLTGMVTFCRSCQGTEEHSLEWFYENH